MIELFPQGFEEVERSGGVELVAYTDAAGEEKIWHFFGAAESADVESGWEERWRMYHQPVRVGRLWIGPPWEEPPTDALLVVIDPGRAFGTGAHPTTQICLSLLQELEPSSLLDVGCGSGVLSVAAAKLGYGPIVAVDYDPIAVETARTNAEANGVAFDARVGDALEMDLPETDIVVANVSEHILECLAPRLAAPFLVASGFYVDQEPPMRGYVEVDRRVQDRWLAILAHRIAPAEG
jgi:ribosomal protein L11 methyltransferase